MAFKVFLRSGAEISVESEHFSKISYGGNSFYVFYSDQTLFAAYLIDLTTVTAEDIASLGYIFFEDTIAGIGFSNPLNRS